MYYARDGEYRKAMFKVYEDEMAHNRAHSPVLGPSITNTDTQDRFSPPFSYSPQIGRIAHRSTRPREQEVVSSVAEATVVAAAAVPIVVEAPTSTGGIVSSSVPLANTNMMDAISGPYPPEDGEGEYFANNAPSLSPYSDYDVDPRDADVKMADAVDVEESEDMNEGIHINGLLRNEDSGGFYEPEGDEMNVEEDVGRMDVDGVMSEATVDKEWAIGDVEPSEDDSVESVVDEASAALDVDGETWLFSKVALSELHLLRENALLRGKEMDEAMSEFLETGEYGALVPSTEVINVASVAAPPI
jgi:hypothetical protein